MYEYALFRLNSQVMFYILAANSFVYYRRNDNVDCVCFKQIPHLYLGDPKASSYKIAKIFEIKSILCIK